MELELGPVALADLLEDGIAMVRDRAGRQGVALELDVAPALGTVPADELKLKQVVLNLLSNAVKFTPAGGRVVVTARAEGGEAVVSVRDTGIGVAEQERERIFEAFQRGGRGARQSTEGTGLGLTLSRRIVDLHGGRLWMESRVGEGSTFSFALPVAARRAGAARAGARRRAPARSWSWRTTAAPPSCCGSTSRTPATASAWRATARRASSSSGGPRRPPSSSTSCCRG